MPLGIVPPAAAVAPPPPPGVSSSQSLSARYAASEGRFRAPVTTREPGCTIPGSVFRQIWPGKHYRVPNRPQRCPALVDRSKPAAALLLEIVLPLLHVAMFYHREMCESNLTYHADRKLVRFFAYEALLRSLRELQSLPVRQALEPRHRQAAETKAAFATVFGAHAPIGASEYESFHHSIGCEDDCAVFDRLCTAYNQGVGRVANVGEEMCLDEIVINHPHASVYPSKKFNATGPEFLLVSGKLPGTDDVIHYAMVPRLWAKGFGPAMPQLVQSLLAHVWLEGVKHDSRPVVCMDARFSSGGTLKLLLDKKMGPFITSLNTAWHKNVVHVFSRVPTPKGVGSITLWCGNDIDYDDTDEPLPTRAVAAANVAAANAAAGARGSAHVASAGPKVAPKRDTMSRQFKNIADHGIDIGKRKRSPTQDAPKEDDDVFDQDFDAPDEDFEDAGADDLPEGGDYAEDDAAAVGFNITQQFLLLEKYSGINTQKRRRAIYLLTNFVSEFDAAGPKKQTDPAPVYRLFEQVWRYCDILNRKYKEMYMMYKHLSMRRFNDSQVRFDFVITSALHLAYTVIAVSAGFTTNSGRGNYSWEEFTVYAASVFEDTYIAMGKEKLLKVCACRSIWSRRAVDLRGRAAFRRRRNLGKQAPI